MGVFLFITASRLALGPTQLPVQCVTWSLSLGVKRPRCEADHSPHPVPRSRMRGVIPPLAQYAFMARRSDKSTGITLLLPLRRKMWIFTQRGTTSWNWSLLHLRLSYLPANITPTQWQEGVSKNKAISCRDPRTW